MNPGSCTLSPRDDITYENIFTVFDELDHVKGRTLCEGIKKLRNSTGIERVAKGVQLLLLTIVVASVSELVCETFGSIMGVAHKLQFFTSPTAKIKPVTYS